jgi:small conductance mechanosensitive channel
MEPNELLEQAQNWLLTTGMDWGKSILVFLIILIIGKIVSSKICAVADTALQRANRVSDMLREFAVSVLNKVLFVLVLMLGLAELGVDIGPLVAGLGVTGFILGFAFQDSLANLSSGVMILLNEPFKVGDVVETGGHLGSVVELNMMAVTMNTPDNKRVIIPNKSVWGSSIVNYTANDTRRVDVGVGISYAADIDQARTIITEVLTGHEKVLAEPAPVVELVEMADSSLNLVVRPWSKTEDYWDVFFGVNQQIKEKLDAANIEIPFPQRVVHQAS